MRVLIVNYEFPPVGGGAGRASWHLCRELARIGARVDVVTSHGTRNFYYHLEGARIYSLKVRRKSVHETGIRGMAEFLIRAFFLIRRLVRENKYDLIHYFFSIPTGLLSFCVGRSLPFIVSLRGGDVPGYNPGELRTMHRLLTPVNRLIWRRADAVVALSDDLGRFAKQIEPTLNYQVIYNGADTHLFQPSEIPRNTGGPVRILTVARLLELKGIQYLLEALSQLPKDQFHLSIAGTGYFETALKRKTALLNLTDSVAFLGPVAHHELPRIYCHADIFVLPSYGDSFGQVFTEAMACGLPIIAARSGGVQEFVENGINGFLVPPKDVKSIADAICRLASSRDLRNKMGQNNIQKIKSQFGWDAVARQYADVCNHILERRN
ncbi:Glycosyl transferase, family I [Desulfonema magnum]|uniref:Glycosyl transferase, family I n=2 Tax=Desulfonema magnum TaxID=45655 RepID=A0A975GLC4_9BACT|nr:Glycosyl transferase, family I [Desulfonema magnum]